MLEENNMAASIECADRDQRGVVLRVKRKRTDDPVEALVVSHVIPAKKAHLTDEEPEDKSKTTDKSGNVKVDQLFRFLGTCNEDDSTKSKDILKNIKTKPISHGNPKKGAKGITEQLQKKQREAKKESHSDARFKILSNNRYDNEPTSSNKDSNANKKPEVSELKRTSSDDSADSADDEVRRLFKVYDVIRDEENKKSGQASASTTSSKPSEPEDTNVILCNSVKMIREKLAVSEGSRPVNIAEKGYVYDFYYAPSSQNDLGDILEITGVNNDLFLETIDREFEEMFDDEDDSNDENNWRNDYPDEGLWSSDDEDSKTKTRQCLDEDFGFDMDDDPTKYHKQAFGEDLSSDDDELDYYGEPCTLSSRKEAYQENLSDDFESEGF
ncbi:probable RNA polymerase II nuclear localization protein SLC7A6OS [Actinia tenebrosa]|uniref:Probable RNA polymerase II nuclear localization protein SLC7A6OS n=1 Tax=Actinia tenebrosa TaxID=6105 RepID=A0A6P8HBR3_ACTTE|nr:probable RNA polymerase II nuclear localization protein SLC7A6OS [Actinia tenebrosa]